MSSVERLQLDNHDQANIWQLLSSTKLGQKQYSLGSRGKQIPTGCTGDLSMEVALCHTTGTYNFELGPRSLENSLLEAAPS